MIPFRNEPLTDFTVSQNQLELQEALKQASSQLGNSYPLIIAGETYMTPEMRPSRNPCQHQEIIGLAAQATPKHAEQALQAAWEAYDSWSKVPIQTRADYLFKLAAILRRKKAEMTAWLVLEVGKNWVEADADAAEAIDFCEYYARQALQLGQPPELVPIPGERNTLDYIPLGVGLIIAPWNFPLAILLGMTTAALVTGNTVIIKPSNNATVIGAKAFELMQEADIPPGVINFLPGSGGKVGELLVTHPQTRFINFTGSKDVGLRINQQAAITQPGQIWMKRVIAEMGGKDCIIVDETADLEAAAQGIVKSAFGFQGQKCSACSRAIVVDSVYDEVLARVVELTQQLHVGPASDNHAVNAVIDDAAYTKITSYIENSRQDGRLVCGGEYDDSQGFYIEPTIFADIAPDATLAQEEVFGPVLAFIRAQDWQHSIAIGNNTPYGLTGSVYSNNRNRLEQAKRDLHVGNLYLNRGCTGALVGAQPFGGFNMSGTNSKAGGPDYLPLFMQAKSCSERL